MSQFRYRWRISTNGFIGEGIIEQAKVSHGPFKLYICKAMISMAALGKLDRSKLTLNFFY